MSEDPLVESARDAIRSAMGALLADVDVAAVHAVERTGASVTRRGKGERLGVALPDEVFEALRKLGADTNAVELVVDGHRLRALPVSGERVLLFVEKRPSLDVMLSSLVEEGMVPPEPAASLLTLAREGHGLVVVGSSRVGARRLVAAVARELSGSAAVMGLDEDLQADWLLPSPLAAGDVVERARTCVAAGAEVLLSLGLSLADARALATAELPVSIVAVVEAASAAAYHAAFRRGGEGGPVDADALTTQVVVVGRGSAGKPVLVEGVAHRPSLEHARRGRSVDGRHGYGREEAERHAHARSPNECLAVEPVEEAQRGDERSLVERRPRERGAEELSRAERFPVESEADLPPLVPLSSGPPLAWASTSPEDDPGWELGDPRDGPSAFDGVMAEVKARPTFTPRPPPVHPQTRALRGDPFGGLTLEPPGGALDDDDATVASDTVASDTVASDTVASDTVPSDEGER